MIVSGERRWQAHRIANIKTIPCVVKEYKKEIDFKIDSLIENIHREDLTPTEKGKFCLEIKKDLKANKNQQVANLLKKPTTDVNRWIDDYEFRNTYKGTKYATADYSIIRATRGMEEKDREKITKFAVDKKKYAGEIEEFVPVYKKADEPTKEALLSGKVSVEEAKKGNIPEPIQFERTANDVVDDILSNLHDFKFHMDEFKKKEINIEDLDKSKSNKAMTTSILHLKILVRFVNALRQRGAKPDKMILALIKANGKI